MRRLLFVTHSCYVDDTPSACAAQTLVGVLARNGFECEVLCGSALDSGGEVDLAVWLAARGLRVDVAGGVVTVGSRGVRPAVPPHLRTTVRGVPVTIHRGRSGGPDATDNGLRDEFLRLLEIVLARSRPEVVIALGGGRLASDALSRAHGLGAATVLYFHDPDPRQAAGQEWPVADAVLVTSQFAANYCREAFGVPCTVLPPLFDGDLAVVERPGPEYLTFIDPTPANGIYPFARIAHELGRRRPDIAILVVEGRGTEGDLAACGLDLREPGNLHVMPLPGAAKEYWAVTRVCVLPQPGWETPLRVVAEALVNGIPVLAADRGGLPETLGQAGIVLPLPDWLTPATRRVPTPAEIGPWVEAIIRLWDEEQFAQDHRHRALAEARRQSPEVIEARYRQFFEVLRPGPRPGSARPPGRARAVVLVPHLNGIDWECEQGLRRLETGGVKVVRRGGSSAIDVARNELLSSALHDGFESFMFIDADVGFDPLDAFRLLARPEPVVCGIYAKKGRRGLASLFAEDVKEVVFGLDAPGLYPLRFAATGFLRIKAGVLRQMIAELELPLCNTKWGRGVWPFFMPMIIPQGKEKLHYLSEDWAFSHRLGQIGVTPQADTSIRLWHWGRYEYGWEDAGADRPRHRSYNLRITDD